MFVHGLRRAGHPVWMSSGKKPGVWPKWLAQDIENLGVWSVEHDSAPTRWRGFAMALPDRAANILAALLIEPRLSTGEIRFVTHSFGGLILEQLIRLADARAATETKVADLLKRIRGVAFLGTPHTGADLASWGGRFGVVFRPSAAAKGLPRNDPNLTDLKQWFRRYARENGFATLSLIETRPVRVFGKIVKPDSADAGFLNDPIPVDADHYGIASPNSKNSEIYRLVLEFLQAQGLTTSQHTIVAGIASDAKAVIGLVSDNSVALQRIERKLDAEVAEASALVPSVLVDSETIRRLTHLRKIRFFDEFNSVEAASNLARELQLGELRGASRNVKSRTLGWCARILAANSEKREEAQRIVAAANDFGRSDEVIIAEALLASYANSEADALRKLASVGTRQARSVSFIVVAYHRTPALALDWLRDAGLTAADLDADGKCFVLRKQIEVALWPDLLAGANGLCDRDFDDAPILYFFAAGAHLVQALPAELRSMVFWTLPFEGATIPFSDEPEALAERRAASELYAKLSAASASLHCTRMSNDAGDRALWLNLHDPLRRTEARNTLEAGMRDPASSLRLFPLARAFGLQLDLNLVEQEINRQTALSGGTSVEAAVARYSMMLAKPTPVEAAEYIAKHRAQFVKHISIEALASAEIQVLAQAEQIEAAEARWAECKAQGLPASFLQALSHCIAEAKGRDSAADREEQFKRSDDLSDLANLVQRLEVSGEWKRLTKYAKALFDRTHNLPSLSVYIHALFEMKDYVSVVTVLRERPAFVAQSIFLESLLAWSLYWTGDFNDCKAVIASVRAKRDGPNERRLSVNLAVASGDWDAVAVYVEQDWDKRAERDAEELLRAAYIGRQLGMGRARELVVAAVEKAPDNVNILLGSYNLATKAGWEDEETFKWLDRATELSGPSGPIKRVSLREVADMQPDWQQRQTQTWDELHTARLPLFAAGVVFHRSLVELHLLPALANSEQVDPRKRSLIYSYTGMRLPAEPDFKTVAIDPSALLTLGALDALDDVFARFEKVVVPHSTLGWLFEEREKIQFHQPRRIRDAKELKQFVDDKALQKLESTVTANEELSAEVGDNLASLIANAQADYGNDRRQRIVVRSSPVHRVGSLAQEEADLSAYAGHMCGCLDLVEALKLAGQLTVAEEAHARNYLATREKPWADAPAIQHGSVVYLDDLSISYLQHLGLLGKLRTAGLTGIVHENELADASGLIRYESLSVRGSEIIERIRRKLADGIANGHVKVMASTPADRGDGGRIRQHPTMQMLEGLSGIDAVVVDDRFLNQNIVIQVASGDKPVATTLDLVCSSKTNPADRREYLTALRRLGFGFIPVSVDELNVLLGQAAIVKGALVETAELRAIRESLQLAKMSVGLQIPKEQTWLDSLTITFLTAIKAQWKGGASVQDARARSTWLLRQFDIRQWAPRYKVPGESEASEAKYRAQIVSLAHAADQMTDDMKIAYWDWVEESLLQRVAVEERQVFVGVVEHIRSTVTRIALDVDLGELNEDEAGDEAE